jgi:frataxin-like iron-binding protein CyaY
LAEDQSYHKPLDERMQQLEESIPKLQSEIDISKVTYVRATSAESVANTSS